MSRHHRLRLWLLNRQAKALMRRAGRINRPHRQSTHMIGGFPPAPDYPSVTTALGGLMIAVCVVLALNVMVQP